MREYFLFDPLNEYLPRQLIGYRLIGGRYEELAPVSDGGALSAELGMRLVPRGEQLALVSFRTGQRILPPPEALEQERLRVEELLRLAEDERRRTQAAEEQARESRRREEEARELAEGAAREAEAARQRAEEATKQVAALAEELARLKAQLQPPEGQG